MTRTRSRRAAGTRTMVDVLRGFMRGRMTGQPSADQEAVKNGEQRVVRCYVQPEIGEHRRQWKPGYLHVLADTVSWKGSSRRWDTVVFPAGEWTVRARAVARSEHVYRSFRVLECSRQGERHVVAVPKLDVDLCISVLTATGIGNQPHRARQPEGSSMKRGRLSRLV